MRSLKALLDQIVDYAGLFPPSALSMPRAVENYAQYRRSEHAWMLGRFVAPVARLDEFEAALPPGENGWTISALAGANLDADLERIARFTAATVGSLEIRAGDAEQIRAAAQRVPQSLTLYFEVPASTDPAPLLAALRRTGARAKIRTGGIAPEMFPKAEEVARFLAACAAAGIAFKATAGLHHPLRCHRPLTYSPDGPSGWMFGFVNVFMAAVFARHGLGEGRMADLLLEEDAHAFQFDDAEIGWRGCRAATREISAVRRDFAIGFGSCSFEEPVRELRALGLV